MMTLYSQIKQDRKFAFEEVMHAYEVARSARSPLSCEGFYASLEGHADGISGSGSSSRIVRPNMLDFVCDVELAAKSVLFPTDFELFMLVYANQERVSALVTNDPCYKRQTDNIVDLVGQEFSRRRIHPSRDYFKAKDVRG